MRAVIQRVSSASVTVDSHVVSSISQGLMCLIGIGDDDTEKDSDYIVNKILNLKVFDDPASGAMWKKSVKDIEGEILCVSQFTLMAKTIKGAKPDFHKASHGNILVIRTVDLLTKYSQANYLDRYTRHCSNPWRAHTFLRGLRVRPSYAQGPTPTHMIDGQFGAMMSVALTNEGPVTLTVDSRKFEYTPIAEASAKKRPAEGGSTPGTSTPGN
ncbi:unnamed protein product [Rhizoctonia solani]|uniref:D-aminoacyl-tRNA deacylase n=1 Tax=Rhizoctonia solani TaxID=456999 RepID=A0A8H3GYA3_9AGAM|nr:unnamed protein product [Rhizoctonia solani]